MKVEKIKPIPKYILAKIRKTDLQLHPTQDGHVRYYAYLTKNAGELVMVTVAVKNRYNKWYYKQCIIHGIHSDKCFVKDMCYNYIAGYIIGWHAEGLTNYAKWYESDDWGWAYDKDFNVHPYVVNEEFLYKFPEYKYAAWEQTYMDLFKYLRLYETYPQIEYLTKFDLKAYSDSVQVLKKIGKDKKFMKWLMHNREKLSRTTYYISVLLKAYRTGLDIDELQREHKFKLDLVHDEAHKALAERCDAEMIKRIEKYVYEQQISFATFQDYINACKALELDLSIERNMFPKDFKTWHDIRIDEYKTLRAMRDAEKRKELYEKFTLIAEKYLGLQHSKNAMFIAIIAKSPAELVFEGEALHHCVGRMGYDQKFVREESLIFFIREKNNPEVPYVTVEYSPISHKILQLHGMNNCSPNDEATQYIQKVWLPYANRHLKQIAA